MTTWQGRKSRPASRPYEVWESEDGSWRWDVLQKHQGNDDKPYASWFCNVHSPYCTEMGDVYVSEIKGYARLVRTDYDAEPPIVMIV